MTGPYRIRKFGVFRQSEKAPAPAHIAPERPRTNAYLALMAYMRESEKRLGGNKT